MTIIDEACLDTFRWQTQCELCKARTNGCHPHHWRCRGRGSAWQLDVPICLLAICYVCHAKCHNGSIRRDDVLAVIAKREGLRPEVIRQAINDLLRMPKGSDYKAYLETVYRTGENPT